MQRYGKVFKLPKNYVIIFENQAKLMAWICWAVFKNVIQMLSKQADCLSYFIDYQLIVFFDKSLTKSWISKPRKERNKRDDKQGHILLQKRMKG